MNTLILFEKALDNYRLDEIAEQLSLHTGTLKRWMKKKEVPKEYKYNFLRLLNISEKDTAIDFKGKDQFFTKSEIAKKCFLKFQIVAEKLDIDLSDYNYIEPSAGSGSFFDILPKNRRVGIDIDPQREDILKYDYLKWRPKNKKNIVIGNPPFGLRGNLALQFINHSFEFADMVVFILPQLFESDGKGSPMKRVKGYKLAYSEKIPKNSFQYPDGTEIKINTIFQVWTKIKTTKIKLKERKIAKSFIKIYSLSDGGTPSTTRNKKMLDKCDIYVPSTTFGEMKIFKNFESLPHRRGYGVVILKNKKEIKKIFKENNWNKTAFLSTNSALNLRMSLIEDVIVKKGFYDKK